MENLLVWGLSLLGASLLLIVLEVFVPSGGIIGILALGCAVSGVVCLFRVNWQWGTAGLLTMLILGPMCFSFGMKALPHTPMGKKILFGAEGEERPVLRDDQEQAKADADLIGREGITLTALRPIGTVRVEGRRVAAFAETGMIEAKCRVRVIAAVAGEVKVRRVEES